MIKIYREKTRGRGNFSWLQANYSFSFSNYYNPKRMGFRDLKVINEDFISPNLGFPSHSHQNMEILTIVLNGRLTHKDSLGNIAHLHPGRIQRMYAGSGIEHSEYNSSSTDILNLLQIWIEPNQYDLTPEYEEKTFKSIKGEQILLSPDGRDNSIKFYNNSLVSLAYFENDEILFLNKNDTYIHVISGEFMHEGEIYQYGDSLEIQNVEKFQLQAAKEAKLLIFRFLD